MQKFVDRGDVRIGVSPAHLCIRKRYGVFRIFHDAPGREKIFIQRAGVEFFVERRDIRFAQGYARQTGRHARGTDAAANRIGDLSRQIRIFGDSLAERIALHAEPRRIKQVGKIFARKRSVSFRRLFPKSGIPAIGERRKRGIRRSVIGVRLLHFRNADGRNARLFRPSRRKRLHGRRKRQLLFDGQMIYDSLIFQHKFSHIKSYASIRFVQRLIYFLRVKGDESEILRCFDDRQIAQVIHRL